MKHLYKIEDPLEIKLIVLHALIEADKPLTIPQITEIALTSAEINYFDLLSALDFLVGAKEIYTYKSMEQKLVYALTAEGQTSAQHFYMRIPLEIREYVSQAISDMFASERKRRQLTAKVVPVNYNQFSAEMHLLDHDLPVLELRFFAGDMDHAERICERFKNNSADIYAGIAALLTTEIKSHEV